MGMPISNYILIDALANGSDSHEVKTALDTLRPFNLFTFIIHDPQSHPDFDERLNSLFDRLDYVTGDSLLFFALVDPPAKWLSHAGRRHYFRLLSSVRSKELLDPKNAVTSADKGMTAYSLAHSLNIPAEMLPCIVVTPDFRSERFTWFRTCPSHLEQQMKGLGYIAERAGRTFIGETSYDYLFGLIHEERLDLCNGHGDESLEDSLAKALADVLSLILAGNSPDYALQRRAREQAQKTVSKLHNSLQVLKGFGGEEETERLDELCLSFATSLAHLNPERESRLDMFVPINKELLEGDSYYILNTAYKVLNLLMSRKLEGVIPGLDETRLDYTPGVICLAKVFEKEINLSIVHWIRNELGVSLPEYFNKPQPHVRAVFVPQEQGGRPVDFNARRQARWLPPAIGQSEVACRELSRTKRPPQLDDEWFRLSWELLLDRWSLIKRERNRAAHTELVDRSSALTVKAALDDLAKNQVFEKLYQMKREYRGY